MLLLLNKFCYYYFQHFEQSVEKVKLKYKIIVCILAIDVCVDMISYECVQRLYVVYIYIIIKKNIFKYIR